MKFTVLGAPRSKKNHMAIITNKRTGRPMVIQSKQSRGWEASAIPQLQAQWRGRPPMNEPVHMRAIVYRERNVGDLLNFLAPVCDALERAGVVINDRLIESVDGSRLDKDAKNPRVEIELETLDEALRAVGQ